MVNTANYTLDSRAPMVTFLGWNEGLGGRLMVHFGNQWQEEGKGSRAA